MIYSRFDGRMCACESDFSDCFVYYFIWILMMANLRFPDLVIKQAVMHNLTTFFLM